MINAPINVRSSGGWGGGGGRLLPGKLAQRAVTWVGILKSLAFQGKEFDMTVTETVTLISDWN